MTDAAGTIMQLLNDNWSLSMPSKADVYWAASKVEAVDFARIGKNYVIACYAPMTVASSKPSTFELWEIEENIVVDVICKVTSTVQQACGTRELMRAEVYRIMHGFETSKDTHGFSWVHVKSEGNKSESPDLVRVSLLVTCSSFKAKP